MSGRRDIFGDEIDGDRLAEAALAILSLTFTMAVACGSSGLDLMDLLQEKGSIVDAQSRAKSVVLTEEGERLIGVGSPAPLERNLKL